MRQSIKPIILCSAIIMGGCSAGNSSNNTPNNTNSWAWVSGSNESNAFGVYGTKGTASNSNNPGARWGSISWSDESGNFWLFGGDGNASAESGNLNDLWKYNPTINQWTWMSGSNMSSAYGNYGESGVSSPSNVPGSRSGGVSWRDNNGNLWMFGGLGRTENASHVFMNDIWEYNPTNNQWTWQNGRDGHNVTGIYGQKGVANRLNSPRGRIGATSWTDSSGNLWMFGGKNATHRFNDLWKYNPNTNQWAWMSGESTPDAVGVYGTQGQENPNNEPGSRFDAISWVDNNGTFWIFGGLGSSSSGIGLLNDLWKYNPKTNQWTWVNGSNLNGQSGVYGTMGVPTSTTTPGARNHRNPFAWSDKNGNLWMFGGAGNLNDSIGLLNDLWMYNPSTNQWTWKGGSSESGEFGIYGNKGSVSPNNTPGARRDSIGWIDNNNNMWLFGGAGNGSSTNGNLNDLWKYNGINAESAFPTIQYLSFPQIDSSATFITGIRQIIGSSNVYISAISPSTTASKGLVYAGQLNGNNGQWYQFTPPIPSGQILQSTNLYGPNSNSDGTITVVGSYNTLESGALSFGLLYKGAISDGNNPNNWKTLMPPGANSTILHSNMGGLAAGNYNVVGNPAGKSFIYDIAAETYTNIHRPGEQEKSMTIYGIWWNGGTSYTIAGGYSLLNESGLDIAYVADYDSGTHAVSNWTDYYYNNLSGTNVVSHFEGITSDGNGGYNLAADVFSLGQIAYGVQPTFVHITRKVDKTFNPVAIWTDIIYPGAVLTSANTVYQNNLLGVYSFAFSLTGVNSFIATVPTSVDY
ncbi:MAG: kelch repeat-containing protein [Burkholderiales bacterium]|nr:kelch repeat-containing protein [Burkholderiales bacterium]